MEGRWSILATRAARTGAIDYAHTTRYDLTSMLRERWYLRDIEREIDAACYGRLLPVTAPDLVIKTAVAMLKTAMPWVKVETAAAGGVSVEQAVEMYKKIILGEKPDAK